MVNTEQTLELFKHHFEYTGDVHVNDLTGDISCSGNVNLKPENVTQLPVKFDRVYGHFNCEANWLVNLKGAPRVVGLYFSCVNNPLGSLEGIPNQVNALFWVSWQYNLPLLRLLHLSRFKLKGAPRDLELIMHSYAGQGKSAALNCALELKKAGFARNARW